MFEWQLGFAVHWHSQCPTISSYIPFSSLAYKEDAPINYPKKRVRHAQTDKTKRQEDQRF